MTDTRPLNDGYVVITKKLQVTDRVNVTKYPDVYTPWQWCEANAAELRQKRINAQARQYGGVCWVEREEWRNG